MSGSFFDFLYMKDFLTRILRIFILTLCVVTEVKNA